jgi:hypothetical protein
VLEALRNVSLEDLLAEATAPSRAARVPRRSVEPTASTPRKRGGRLARRSPADIARLVDRIVALLAQHPKGLRSEEIRAKLGLAAKEMPRPLADALAAHRIVRRGQKRATTYLAKSAPPAKAVEPKPASKTRVKAAAKPGKASGAKPAKSRGPKTKRPAKAAKKAAAAPSKPAADGAPGAASAKNPSAAT